MTRRNLPLIFSAVIALLFGLPVVAQSNSFLQANPTWVKPFPAFRIVGNLYYVGSEDLAAYLIVTPQGNILINSNLESSPPQIKKAIESLGFKFSDTKILLISHGHFDHCAGSAEIKRLTGAKYEVMDRDVSVVESGGHTDFNYASGQVDVVSDGEGRSGPARWRYGLARRHHTDGALDCRAYQGHYDVDDGRE